ncbi:MAG TPA: hypothetical protein VIN59_03750, partial [Alphaproteobacteria bacterium]
VKETVETPSTKETTVPTEEKATEPASQPVEKKTELPVTNAVKDTLSTVGTSVDKLTTGVNNTATTTTGTVERVIAKPLELNKPAN